MRPITLLLGLLVFPVLAEQHCGGGDSCCDSKEGGCAIGEGDCDVNSHCADDLVCGTDNCLLGYNGTIGHGFDETDDCCMPSSYLQCPCPGCACPSEVVWGIVEFALGQLSEGCLQTDYVVTHFESQECIHGIDRRSYEPVAGYGYGFGPGYLYYFDLKLPAAPGCDFQEATKVCHVVVFQEDSGLNSDLDERSMVWDLTNCTAPPPVTTPAPTHAPTPAPTPAPNDFNVTVSCNEMKNMHHAIARARIAYHCSDEPATGEQTECDRQLLLDLSSCSLEDSQYCFFKLIANEQVCFPDNQQDEICNAMHRITNFLLYARQAFCNIPDPRSGCGFWTGLGCTAAILAADAACAVLNAPDGETLLIPCVTGVMGVGSSCIPCICDVLGIGGC